MLCNLSRAFLYKSTRLFWDSVERPCHWIPEKRRHSRPSVSGFTDQENSSLTFQLPTRMRLPYKSLNKLVRFNRRATIDIE